MVNKSKQKKNRNQSTKKTMFVATKCSHHNQNVSPLYETYTCLCVSDQFVWKPVADPLICVSFVSHPQPHTPTKTHGQHTHTHKHILKIIYGSLSIQI